MAKSKKKSGTVVWMDLTVQDAEAVRDFYRKVVGWESDPVSMGDYDDYCMLPDGGEAVAGVCHARGANASIPPAWVPYIIVDDLDHSVKECIRLGGQVIVGPMKYGADGRYCIIKDPAGAVMALYGENK